MLLNFRDGDGINTAKRLVEHHELRTRDKRPRDRQTTFLTATQRQCLIFCQVVDSKLPEQFIAASRSLPAGNSERLQDRHNVLLDGQFSEDGFLLGKVTHSHTSSAMHRKPCHVTILKVDSTTVGPHQPHYKIKRGGFASAIWSQKADNLAFVHMDINSIHDRPAAIDLDQFIRTENRRFDSPLCWYDRRLNF